MSDNNNEIIETCDNTHIINSQNSIFSLNSDIMNYESSSFQFNISTSPSLIINNILFFNDFTTKFFKELLQEIYTILLNIEVKNYEIDQLNEFINNFLVDHDLNPKSVLRIMKSSFQNSFYYSSLIGYFYQHGIGCEVDEIRAFEIFSNAIKYQKVDSSQSSSLDQVIAFCDDEIKKLNRIILQYFYSLFLYKDIILNRKYNYKLHIKDAEKGDPKSQYFIGSCYYDSKGITGDNNKAVEWYSKSSERGDAEAMYALGRCYFFGCGIKEDRKKAFELYLRSAEGGCKLALFTVGRCYHYGHGILRNEYKAFEWYLKAAKKGHIDSQYIVAKYNKGYYCIPTNEKEGYYWNRKAALNGHVGAQYELIEYKNAKKAFKWYLKLANDGRLRAIYLVAKCYRDGIGTNRNLIEATKWFQKYKSLRRVPITLNDFLNGFNVSLFYY